MPFGVIRAASTRLGPKEIELTSVELGIRSGGSIGCDRKVTSSFCDLSVAGMRMGRLLSIVASISGSQLEPNHSLARVDNGASVDVGSRVGA